jgi:hypothetical protein
MVPQMNLSKRIVDNVLLGAWKEIMDTMAVGGGYISGSVVFISRHRPAIKYRVYFASQTEKVRNLWFV